MKSPKTSASLNASRPPDRTTALGNRFFSKDWRRHYRTNSLYLCMPVGRFPLFRETRLSVRAVTAVGYIGTLRIAVGEVL
jgi:hypothetical protein